MTQDQLGKACGVTKQTIFKYENNIISNIPTDKIQMAADALGVSSAYLMGWAEKTPTPKGEREIQNPDIRMIARAGKKMTPEQAEILRKYAQYMFPEAFVDDDT